MAFEFFFVCLMQNGLVLVCFCGHVFILLFLSASCLSSQPKEASQSLYIGRDVFKRLKQIIILTSFWIMRQKILRD